MLTREQLAAIIEARRAEIQQFHARANAPEPTDDLPALTEDDETRFAAALDEMDQATAELAALEARSARVATALSTPVVTTEPTYRSAQRPAYGGDETRSGLVSQILRANEHRIEGTERQRHFESILSRFADDDRPEAVAMLRAIRTRSTPEYQRAWGKAVTGQLHALTDAERSAFVVGTNTGGGYLVPTHLDPTLILTNSGSANIMRQLARKVQLTTGANTWHGVTTAGASGSWDGELVEVSDGTPAVDTAAIPVYKAQAFMQASIEAVEDIPGLSQDLLALFGDLRDRLEGAAFMTGGGTNSPRGIFTALAATTNSRIVSTTAATIDEAMIQKLWYSVPQRWRRGSSWLMNPIFGARVKSLGTAVNSQYSGDLTQAPTQLIYERPAYYDDDAPSAQTTTALDQEIIFGDLSQYVIVDKPGSFAIEYIPVLFNTANNLPDGRRGWYGHWRVGGDVPNPAALRILLDKTSA